MHPLPARDRRRLLGLLARGRGAHQAPRKHLPVGQYRARQRAGAALRPHARGRLGGRGRRSDEAVRFHELPSRAWPRRPLLARRPLLPGLEGPPVRLLHRVHRARGEDQQEHAVLLPREDHARPQLPGEGGQGQPSPSHGRRLQGQRRRPARVPGAQADRAPARRGRRGLLLRLPRPRAARARPLVTDLDGSLAAADCVAIVTAHSGVDYERVTESATLVVDFRNATGRNGSSNGRVWKL